MVLRRGRSRTGCTLLAALLAAVVLAPAPAQARVSLVATGTPNLVFLDITTRQIAAQLALPGPARAVAISPDGQRGYVTAGPDVVAVDVNNRAEAARTAFGVAPEIADIELARSGTTLYAVQGTRLLVLDATTLATTAAIELGDVGGQLAVGGGDRGGAAVTLAGGRVAIVSLPEKRLLRTVKLKDALGVVVDDAGVTWVTARGKLRTIGPGQPRVRKKPIALPPGAGGAMTLSPGRSRMVVGAAPGGFASALVDLRSARVQRLVSGPGPGRGAWYPDASRILIANGGSASVSLVSPFSRARVGVVSLPGTAPADIVVQAGLALISGTEGPDQLTGTRGADRLDGLGGDDVIRGGRDKDVLNGGPGDDRLSGGAFSDEIDGGDGNDFMVGGTGDDKLKGGSGDDGADGGTGNDTIEGEDGNDNLDGGDGDDTIMGGPGDDSIVEKGLGDDKLLDGGLGNDTIKGGRGSEARIIGGLGNDQLFGETGSERITGGPGEDFIDGGRAGDRLEGNEGNDTLLGDAGNDHLYGHENDDKLDGGSGMDELLGFEGNDTLIGGTGPDVFDGGPGDDTIRAADDSADTVNCGPGNDTVFVESDAPTRDALTDCETTVAVAAEPDSDKTAVQTIRGTRNPDRLFGTSGDDSIFGRGGADRIYAQDGNDYVDGDAGDDRLHGGPGDDTIAGRRGNDTLWGDDGNDRITGDRGRDHILGGLGDDTIFGNIDPDVIDGGPGNDRINVVHGGRDSVVCGLGEDVVFADSRDVVAGDCESVRR